MTSTAWSFVHIVSWSVYAGGTIVMELVWRPAQEHLPASQTAVACQWMGRRYRWLALTALLAAGVSGFVLLGRHDARSEHAAVDVLSWSTSYGRTVLALIAVWMVLLAVLASLSVIAHPALHARTSSSLSEIERQAARLQVQRAIRRMDLILRLEVSLTLVALLLGASLRTGGLF